MPAMSGRRLAGSFGEPAVDEGRSGTDQGDEAGALTARQRSCADSISLVIFSAAAGNLAP
jgi:hypothetical protein